LRGRVLIIAGSDSGGGAGIQADIKTVMALDGYATTAVTALTAQNTHGVFGIIGVPPEFVRQQMRVVLEDIGADALKTGMLHNAAVIDAVAAEIAASASGIKLVVDPVMVATAGTTLLDPAALDSLKSRLVPRAAVITPNVPEAEALAARRIGDLAGMQEVACALLGLGCAAVLLKGGHLDGPVVRDVLASAGGIEVFESPRIATTSTHGTGCTLASAIATGLAQGLDLKDAVARARAYVQRAIATAPGLGHGRGPLNHAVRL
jgi:hydroxymethylpyrimidine/phosphomethylpyrimidine kinase